MTKVGIDAIEFYVPHYFIDLKTLAKERGVDVNKYYIGLGQQLMSITPCDEDVVTLAANASERALKHVDKSTIDMVLFATESGIDQSKSSGIYIHKLLDLPERCRVVEFKQACYGGTAALRMAMNHVQLHPEKRVLVIASDIARYGLNTPGESTQGSGAAAIVISAEPRILEIEPESGYYTEDVMDFWRPNYRDEALVNGKFSCDMYLSVLGKTWAQYAEMTGKSILDHDAFCYHAPFARMAEKGHNALLSINEADMTPEHQQYLTGKMNDALHYNRMVGNTYTASLYIGLISLLEMSSDDLTHKRVGFYSYGSGCVGEYFSGVVQPGYEKYLKPRMHLEELNKRINLTYENYTQFYDYKLPTDGSEVNTVRHKTGTYRFSKVHSHKRVYEKSDA